MIKVLFICHGNICRSPMAEYIFKDLVKKEGLESEFEIASAATSMEEIGNPVYPPARRKLAEYGIRSDGHHARRIERSDYEKYDYLIGMEQFNIRNMMRVLEVIRNRRYIACWILRTDRVILMIRGIRMILRQRTGRFCGDVKDCCRR